MAYSGALTFVRQPASLRVFQRDSRTGGAFGLGSGVVDVAISASAPIQVLEFQLRDYRSQSVVLLPWTTAASNVAAASQTINLTLQASTAWFIVDLRANGDSSSTITLAGGIGVGEVIAAAGQSLATDFWSTTANNDSTTIAGLGVNISAFCSALATWDGGTLPTSSTAWAPPSDNGAYRSTFAAELLRLVVAASGVNAALVGYGHSGTDIGTYWLPGLADYTNLASVLSTAGGKFGTFLWCQGHNDADARSGSQYHLTPASIYLADLQNLFGSLTSTFASMSFQRILCSIPAIAGAASLKYSISGIEAIRSAHLRYTASDSLATYVDGLDVGLSTDGIHPSQAGNINLARHFYRAFLGRLRANSAGDRGPAFAGAAVRASGSPKITLPVRHAGGTALALVGDPSSALSHSADSQRA